MIGSSLGSTQSLRALLADVETVPIPEHVRPGKVLIKPFVTLSREPGAGALPLAQRIADRLNEIHPTRGEWTSWDREILEKVAADENLSQQVLQALEETTQSWLTDFFASMSLSEHAGYADRDAIFRKVARAVRALAQMGEKVIVGSGGALLTQKMPGGVHVRLVASHHYRVARLAEQLHISAADAAKRIEQLDRIRTAFFKRYWPGETLRPDLFTLTINTEHVDTETAAELVVKLVKYVEQT